MALKKAVDADMFKRDAVAFRTLMMPAFKGDKGDLQDAEERLARRDKMVATRDEKMVEKDSIIKDMDIELKDLRKASLVMNAQSIEIIGLKARVEELESKSKEWVAARSRANGKLGGRPILHRTAEALEEINTDAAWKWSRSATERVLDVIGEVGEDSEMSIDVLMDSLKLGGYLRLVWESIDIWKLRMEMATEMRKDLQFIWNPELTRRLRDQLCLSYDEVDELRFAFSHNRVGKQLRPRPWLINPHDNKRINFPTPLANRHEWTPLIKAFIEDHGLTRDKQGKIAQRPYTRTLVEQVQRDAGRGWLALDAITEESPLWPTLGADGTAVGKVGFMHVTSDIAANYKPGIAQQNEVNVCTIAAAQTDDHWGGLDEVLCGGYFSGKV